MKYPIKYIIYTALAIFFACSCSEPIDLDVQRLKTKYLSVEAIINDMPDTYQVISLKQSTQYFTGHRPKDCKPVKNATVEVSDGSRTYEFVETPFTPAGEYYSPEGFCAVPGRTYSLTIQRRVGKEIKTYTASSTMVECGFVVDSIDYKCSASLMDSSVTIGVWGRDLPFHNNVLALTAINGNVRPIDKSFGLDDKYFNGQYMEGYPVTVLTQTWERYNAGELYAKPLAAGDTLELYAYTLSDEFYDFYMSFFYNMTASAIPLIATQPANVVTNITGDDVLGYFTTAPVSKGTCVVDDPERTEFRYSSKQYD